MTKSIKYWPNKLFWDVSERVFRFYSTQRLHRTPIRQNLTCIFPAFVFHSFAFSLIAFTFSPFLHQAPPWHRAPTAASCIWFPISRLLLWKEVEKELISQKKLAIGRIPPPSSIVCLGPCVRPPRERLLRACAVRARPRCFPSLVLLFKAGSRWARVGLEFAWHRLFLNAKGTSGLFFRTRALPQSPWYCVASMKVPPALFVKPEPFSSDPYLGIPRIPEVVGFFKLITESTNH